jgi:hypothetical protein
MFLFCFFGNVLFLTSRCFSVFFPIISQYHLKACTCLQDVFTPFKNAVAPELKCACNQIPAPYSEEIKKTETGLRIRPCFPAPARGALPLPKSIEFGAWAYSDVFLLWTLKYRISLEFQSIDF